MPRFFSYIFCLLGFCISGCATSAEYSWKRLPETETVMVPGMTISVTDKYGHGTLQIKAPEDMVREFSWNGATWKVQMAARTKWWYGEHGIYNPDEDVNESHGVSRLLAGEGQYHFSSMDEALKWLQGSYRQKVSVWRNDGLVAAFYVTPSRKQFNVELWQIYIDGKKPTSLPGATDDAIRVTPPS